MRHIRLTITGLLIWGLGLPALAQKHAPEEATSYTAEFSGIVGGGDHAPFWAVSNQYGKMSIKANNAYLDIGLSHHQRISKNWQWGAGLSLVGVVPRYRNVYLQQAYAEIGYQALWLSIGSKERYTSLRNRRLSSGDLTFSANARPIPEINLSIPTFTVVPGTRGWLQVKGDFAVGRSFDESYLEDFSKKGETYNKRILWHHKSLFLRIKDTHDDFPLSLTLGVQHWAQWGGTSTDPSIGEQPHSFKDFLRVFTGSKGDQQASISDQENVLGSHSGSYDFQLSYSHPAWELTAYHQHPFNDKSGMVFENGIDGLWGIEWQPKNLPWLRAVVFEYLNTRDQSGPMHFIWFDHGKYPGVGGGNDDYYNNQEYKTGFAYFNRGIGSPLIISPEYNEDGSLGFKNNRVRDWHVGAEGSISATLDYRILFTVMNGWGRHSEPFPEKRNGTASLIGLTYKHPKLKGWQFEGAASLDTGSLPGENFGFQVKVSKRGVLKRWQ